MSTKTMQRTLTNNLMQSLTDAKHCNNASTLKLPKKQMNLKMQHKKFQDVNKALQLADEVNDFITLIATPVAIK